MNFEEALELVSSILEQGHLSKVQKIVFQRCWQGESYQEIAIASGYEVGYVTDVGSKLWQLLSKAFGKKITKNNFHGVLKQQYMAIQAAQTASVSSAKWLKTRGSFLSLLSQEDTTIQRQDWEEAMDVSIFYGRTAELATLEQWIVQDHCRLITMIGMGGIGKTALAVKVAQLVQGKFNYLIWRSLRNAPPVKDFLIELILFLRTQEETNLPETLDGLLSHLMEYLRSSRCLLILDNAESLLGSGECSGQYRSGYERYGQLLRRVADEQHRSCILLTSREKPIGLKAKEGETLPVRALQLSGLQQAEAKELLKTKGLVAVEDEYRQLIENYAGNPLILKIAATTIKSLFDGDITRFLRQGIAVFGDIWELFDQQFNRLSALEQQVMYWLASHQEWVLLSQLQEHFLSIASERELLEALESLQQRSLIERQSTSFTQLPIIMKYITEQINYVKLTKN